MNRKDPEKNKVKEALERRGTFERVNTEELPFQFSDEKDEQEKKRIRSKVSKVVASLRKKVQEKLGDMTMDEVMKEMKEMAKNSLFPEFAKRVSAPNNETQEDLSLKKDLGSWLVWLKLNESDDPEVVDFCRRYEVHLPEIELRSAKVLPGDGSRWASTSP